MKAIKRLNIYLKLALLCMAVVLLAAICNLFLLFQIYSLIDIPSNDEALAKLETIATLTRICSWLIYGGLVSFLIFLVVGVTQMTKRESK